MSIHPIGSILWKTIIQSLKRPIIYMVAFALKSSDGFLYGLCQVF